MKHRVVRTNGGGDKPYSILHPEGGSMGSYATRAEAQLVADKMETPMNTFSKLDGRVSKKLLAIAASDGFLDFGEDDAKLLDDTRKAMYAELQEALGPFGRVEREMESYGESAEVIFDGQRIGSVVPNTTMGTMDYLSSGGQSVRLTSPATAKRLILSLI